MQLSIVDDERKGVDSGEAAHDKQGAGGTEETSLAAAAANDGSERRHEWQRPLPTEICK